MKIFYTKRSLLIILAFLAVFSLGYLSGKWSGGGALPTMGLIAKEMPIFSVKKSNEVCLTFDISWGEKTLPLVLKVLQDNQVPATFFLSGPWAVRHPAEVKTIVDGGHEIASHGDRHINLSQYPKETVKENISKAYEDLLSVTGRVAPFFRPPNGDYDDVVIDTARELGFETVIWAVDSLDWKNPGPDYMIHRVLTRAFPGAIILCHASDSSKEIHLALPGIIQGLRRKGYKLVTLSKLTEGGTIQRIDPR
ncbi:MAG TPA: polysaccharide deacetylase family sporulation protein PdaB [Firmicutes bacterium]|jgi:peptidoglycan-N-acetylglucosamine deacetylase|nr:polysaccharide deacetylase family sporulation protein PdaB [Bacillota bacterium]